MAAHLEIAGMSQEAYELLESAFEKPPEWERLSPRERQIMVIRTHREPWLTARETGELMGLKADYITAAWQRIRRKVSALTTPVRAQNSGVLESGRVPPHVLIAAAEQARLDHVRAMGSKSKVQKASVQHHASAIRELTNVIQIESGKPTQIVRHEQRESLHELADMLIQEMARHGIRHRVDERTGQTVVEKDITPGKVLAEARG